MIGKILGHYQVGEQLGRGGMGEVYLADDLNLNRKVALKFLPDAFAADPERMARFEREAKLLASLNHPNIAAIYGLEQAEGKRFLVLELVEGETLAQRIGKGALPVDEALGICRQIAEGLEAAHEKGVIHRDLKPANVMITEGDKVKILDFGLAKALSDETQSVDSSQSPTLTEAMTRPGVILGTAAYMSPEQAKGKSVDKRADIWAFGCILYECLTGKRAFEGETVTETLAAVLTKEPDLEKVPAKARLLLRRCLERDLKRRLRDIGEAMAWIESSPEAIPESVPISPPWLWKSIAVVFIAAFVVLTFIHFRGKPIVPNERIQFQITLPTKVSVPPTTPFTLSPDGRRFVFGGMDSNGVLRLWIHALDSLEPKPLIGTETSRTAPPFWSPDSRFVAYDAGGKLKRIDVAGGSAQDICNLSGYAIGGSWNGDDLIIFSDYNGSNTIMRVPAKGGVPSPVTKLNPRDKDGRHVFPVFLPDGRHFLYFCRSSIPAIEGLYVGSLDAKPETQDAKPLLSSTSGAVYVPSRDSAPGQLLFLRGQTLLAQPFNDRRLELMGDPVLAVENVGHYSSMGYFSASTNGVLIYRNGLDDQLSQPTWFDRQGTKKSTAGEMGSYEGLALSPDGTQAVVGFQNHLQPFAHLDIWLLDLLRGTHTPLTSGQSQNTAPIWSHDGRVIFSSNRNGPLDLYEKLANGANEEKLLLGSMNDKNPTSLSKDGRFLLYTDNDPKTRRDLWVLSMENGRKKTPFLHQEFSEFDGRFSPDMRWIAYVSDQSGSSEIYIREIKQIVEKQSLEAGSRWQISQGGGTAPRWKGDGKELYYLDPDGKIMFVEVMAGAVLRSGTPKTLFQPALPLSRVANWDVTADGNRFLMTASVAEASRSPFTVVLNWTSLLKK